MGDLFRGKTSRLWLTLGFFFCFPLAASGQTICPDGYEFFGGDNSLEQASDIRAGILGDENVQAHTFHEGSDEDWVKFAAIGSERGSAHGYQIKTIIGPSGYDIWTYVELYREDGTLIDCFDDDEEPQAYLSYTPWPDVWGTGTFYVRVVNRDCIVSFPSPECSAPVDLVPGCSIGGLGYRADYGLEVYDDTGAPSTVLLTVRSLSTGAGIQGASASAELSSSGNTFQGDNTDSDGETVIDLTAEGNCTVSANHSGYVKKTVPFECRGTKPVVIQLEQGSDPCGTLPLDNPSGPSVLLYFLVLLLPFVWLVFSKRTLRG